MKVSNAAFLVVLCCLAGAATEGCASEFDGKEITFPRGNKQLDGQPFIWNGRFRFRAGKVELFETDEMITRGPQVGTGSLTRRTPSICDDRIVAQVPFETSMTNEISKKAFTTRYESHIRMKNGCSRRRGMILTDVVSEVFIDIESGCQFTYHFHAERGGDRVEYEKGSNDTKAKGKCAIRDLVN